MPDDEYIKRLRSDEYTNRLRAKAITVKQLHSALGELMEASPEAADVPMYSNGGDNSGPAIGISYGTEPADGPCCELKRVEHEDIGWTGYTYPNPVDLHPSIESTERLEKEKA